MTHRFSKNFIILCNKIIAENKTEEEWALIESSDMFHEDEYVGGFDATEMQFCFSVYENANEYWFQLSLEEINEAAEGKKTEIESMEADY